MSSYWVIPSNRTAKYCITIVNHLEEICNYHYVTEQDGVVMTWNCIGEVSSSNVGRGRMILFGVSRFCPVFSGIS
jgi:hypothetical protein